MNRKATIVLWVICVWAFSVLAQTHSSEIHRQLPASLQFWQSKEGSAYIKRRQYRNNLVLAAHFQQVLSAKQKSILDSYECKIIAYLGNGRYLLQLPVSAVSRVQALPFVEALSDWDERAKATFDWDEEIPAEVQQNNGELQVDLITLPQMNEVEVKRLLPTGVKLLAFYPAFDVARVSLHQKHLRRLMEEPWIVSADYVVKEQLHNQFGVTETRTGALQFQLPQLTGKGVRIGVWDGSGLIGPHVDFVNRTSQEEPLMGESFSWREHATHVSGTLAGAGLRFIYGRGIAPEAQLFNYNIVSTSSAESYIPYKMLKAVEQRQIVITQNSYGPSHTCSAGGINYSSTNRSQDLVANAFPELLHVFATGNSGGSCGGYRNTVHGAKNIISVASLDANNQRMWLGHMQSAAGPARDGRLQPHIAAPGVNIFSTTPDHFYASSGWSGTSMAAPHVSGVAALLYQHYRELNSGQTPPAALIRAVLLNGATDLGNPGPDYIFGFGKVHALNAAAAITENRFVLNEVAQGQTFKHYVYVPTGSKQLKIMLSWNDPAALPNALPALVNNLNLQAKSPSGTIRLPLVLNPASPASVATEGTDNLNNNEQIVINLPEEGTWEISVTGASIAIGNTQAFALTWQQEGEFLVLRNPTTHERDMSPVHWDCRDIPGNVTIEFFDGATWQTLGSVPASQGKFAWTPPAIVTNNARIRISATGASGAVHSHTSPPLLFLGIPNITPNPNITPYVPGNNSLTFSWTAAAGADAYEILWLNLQRGAWEHIATVPHTTTTYTVTGLENGIRHWLSVRTRNNTLNASGIFAYAGFGTPTGTGAAQDIALTQVMHQIPAGGCFAPLQPLQIRLTLQNKGLNTIPAGTVIPVAYRINGGAWIHENLTLSADLGSLQTTNYVFSHIFLPPSSAQYQIEAQVQWAADLIFTNNTQAATVEVPSVPVPTINASPALSVCTVPKLIQVSGLPNDGYALSSIAFQPENMSSATELTLTDDGYSGAIPIGFPFEFYGCLFENVFVGAEGFITFRNIELDYVNFLQRAIPNTLTINDFIALAWNDMRFVTGSKIRYQTVGTAPQRRFIVEFLDMASNADISKRVSGQIILYETFNRIELHIARIDASPLVKIIAGIENREGTQGIALPGMNNQSLSSDIVAQAWAFTPIYNGFEWLDNSSTTTTRLFTTPGTYRFRYQRNGCTIEQDIEICNNPPAIAPIADVTTPEDVAVSVPVHITYGVLPETLLTITVSSNNAALIPNSNLVWMGTGAARQLHITPLPNQHGTAQITITATDGTITATRIFQVTVTPVNDLPTVSHFSVDVWENTLRYFTALQFSSHYADVENSPLASIKIMSLPANGQLWFNGAPVTLHMVIPAAQIHLLAYQPNLDFLGTDSFQWSASDGTDFAATPAMVNLRVVKRPEPILPIPTIDPIADVETLEDTPVLVPVRIHYGELSDELLSIHVFADDYALLPPHAFRWIGSNANRRLMISPAPNRFGKTSVTIIVSNGRRGAVQKFNIKILPVNDAPSVVDAHIRVKSGSRFVFSIAFFDALYSDIENDSLSMLRIVQLPANGRLMLNERPLTDVPVALYRQAIANLAYQPAEGFTGKDSFVWQASDGADWSAPATVRIQVWNTPPQVKAWSKRMHWRQTLHLTYSDWLAVFSDADGDLPVAIRLIGDVQPNQWVRNSRPINSGMLLPLDSTTVIRFQPTRETGTKRYSWNAYDGTEWAEEWAAFTVDVWNTPPTVQDFSRAGTGNIVFDSRHFIASYYDADNDSIEQVRILSLPQFGQLFFRQIPLEEPTYLTVAQLNELSYKPHNPAQPQADSFRWAASDGVDYSLPATVRLTVSPLILPQVHSFSKETFENQSLAFSADDFIRHYDYGNQLPDFVQIVSLPSHGTLHIGNEKVVAGKRYALREMAQMVYQPFAEFVGTDGLLFTAGTGNVVAVATAAVSLQVHLQPISAPRNLQIIGTNVSWQRPEQGNINRYEVQIQLIGSENIVVHTFVTSEWFVLPQELATAAIRLRVRAWGFHNNAGPFTEWLSRPVEIVAAAPDTNYLSTRLKLFPNPAHDYVFIQWERMQGAVLQLTDVTGRTIAQWSLATDAGVEPFDLKGLASGYYTLQTFYKGQQYVLRFLIVR
ncbi:MAG: S8 family serine peptidase [Cytophagales bacterium]|nr:S8 family serine peptidase [Bernardetiaceae bacterium]MDW8204047.1 S8 family serine peptidase [Cytophagales bacterium]